MLEILSFFATLIVIGIGGIVFFLFGIAVILKIAKWLIEWVLDTNKK